MMNIIYIVVVSVIFISLFLYVFTDIGMPFRNVKAYKRAIKSKDPKLIKSLGQKYSTNPDIKENTMEMIYQDALSLLKEIPELEQYAVQMGRKFYAFNSIDKSISADHESAIRNDINAATWRSEN